MTSTTQAPVCVRQTQPRHGRSSQPRSSLRRVANPETKKQIQRRSCEPPCINPSLQSLKPSMLGHTLGTAIYTSRLKCQSRELIGSTRRNSKVCQIPRGIKTTIPATSKNHISQSTRSDPRGIRSKLKTSNMSSHRRRGSYLTI
jgi:hypothetical protein